jgi:peptidoglycan hydrolase CwlO-like protein
MLSNVFKVVKEKINNYSRIKDNELTTTPLELYNNKTGDMINHVKKLVNDSDNMIEYLDYIYKNIYQKRYDDKDIGEIEESIEVYQWHINKLRERIDNRVKKVGDFVNNYSY